MMRFPTILAADALLPSRIQMAFTLAYHVIMVPLGVALPTYTLLMNGIGIFKNDPVLRVRHSVAEADGPLWRGSRPGLCYRGPGLLPRGHLYRHLPLWLDPSPPEDAFPPRAGAASSGRAGDRQRARGEFLHADAGWDHPELDGPAAHCRCARRPVHALPWLRVLALSDRGLYGCRVRGRLDLCRGLAAWAA